MRDEDGKKDGVVDVDDAVVLLLLLLLLLSWKWNLFMMLLLLVVVSALIGTIVVDVVVEVFRPVRSCTLRLIPKENGFVIVVVLVRADTMVLLVSYQSVPFQS